MTKSIFVTGGNGFIGSKLISHLKNAGHNVHTLNGNLLDFPSLKEQVGSFLNNELHQSKVVIHLAGISSPPICEKKPDDAFKANTLGTSLLLEAIRETQLSPEFPHFIFASTAHVYDTPADGTAISEETAIKIKNVYAETKIQAESILERFAERNAMPSTILRLFNHAHISQSRDFLISSLYHQIKDLTPNQNEVKVGNLDLYRDIGSLPDLINAFSAVVEAANTKKTCDIFNVCSGTSHYLLDIAKNIAQYLKRPDINFIVDQQRVRANEHKKILGSFSKINKAYGWSATHTDYQYFFN